MKKKRVFDVIQIGRETDFTSRAFDFIIVLAIILNIVLAIFSTFRFSTGYTGLIYLFETISVFLFTIEYALRVWTADYLYPDLAKGRAWLKYIFSFTGLIDLLSFFPFYLPFFFPSGTIAFRTFRIIRILRLFQINHYYDSLTIITDVLKSKRQQLFSSIFIVDCCFFVHVQSRT
ncbi:MAG: ion transporter [Carnobacterium sp.]|uniref:ion transporter n=1 Tax=Carnobacterium sp. TaxID=48221 RepID=UPI003C73E1F2